jgi:hypothetical protein
MIFIRGSNFLGTKFLRDQTSWGPNFSGTKKVRFMISISKIMVP